MSYLDTGRRLPVIVAPEQGESMTSWLERLAEIHQFPSVLQFLRAAPINWRGPIPRDFDRRARGELRDLLSKVTGLEPEELPKILQDKYYLMRYNLRKVACLMCWLEDMDQGRPLYRRGEWSLVFETCCRRHRFPLLDLPVSLKGQKKFKHLVRRKFGEFKAVQKDNKEIIDTLIRFSEGMSWFDRSDTDQWLLLEYLSEVFFEINEDLRGWASDGIGRVRLGIYKLIERGILTRPYVFASPLRPATQLRERFQHDQTMGIWRLAPDGIPYIGFRRQIFFAAIVAFAGAGAPRHQGMQYHAGVTRRVWMPEHFNTMIGISRKALQLD
ncbi:TniQ family protein [Kordiimonas lipolytica]|uniref:TniQ family protein n=1 Tax=Kordiimonas lipolytica TaxID=1662421 RepID=A0ABV8UB89_9PROT|nr:TniQ family protein [Kordiimonas lipolytica]